MLVMMKDILEKEGVRMLYSGLGPTLIRTFPATGQVSISSILFPRSSPFLTNWLMLTNNDKCLPGALFLAYEYSKKMMHQMTD